MTRLFATILTVMALATTAYAQSRQPAQITTQPSVTPQRFDKLDKTGNWIPLDTARAVSPVAYGARCDGTTDDTVALQAWAAGATAGARLVVPGTCVFKQKLTFPEVANVSIDGGGRNGKLLYTGASTTLDPLIAIGGSTGCGANGWAIRGLYLMSSTVMTAGNALTITNACHMQIDNLTIGGNLGVGGEVGNRNFYDALRFVGGNSNYTRGFGLQSSNVALKISGTADLAHGVIDPFFSDGYIVNAKVGLHICGDVGGFVADSTDVLQNGTNVLIDRSCSNKRNAQLVFGSTFMSDVTNPSLFPAEPQIGIRLADPGGSSSALIYKGWLASATNQCFLHDAGTPDAGVGFQVLFSGATIGNCHAPLVANGGVENQNLSAQISFLGVRFFTAQGGRATIQNVAGALPMDIQALAVGADANFSIVGAWNGSYVDAIGVLRTRTGSVAGFTGSKTAGTCVMTINGGIVTNVTGC